MKNIDKLEQFINNNRADFEEAVPSLKAWAEIDKVISAQRPKVISLRQGLAVAASVVNLLVAGASFGIFMTKSADNNLTAQLSEIAPDFIEAEQYYQQTINRKYQQLASYPHDQTIEDDLSQLDDLMNELKEELGCDNEYIREMLVALSEYYK